MTEPKKDLVGLLKNAIRHRNVKLVTDKSWGMASQDKCVGCALTVILYDMVGPREFLAQMCMPQETASFSTGMRHLMICPLVSKAKELLGMDGEEIRAFLSGFDNYDGSLLSDESKIAEFMAYEGIPWAYKQGVSCRILSHNL